MRGVDSFGMATRHPRRWEGQNKTPPADRIPPAAGEPPRCPCHLAVGHLPCYGRAAAHCGGNQHRRRPEPPRRERAPHRSPPAATQSWAPYGRFCLPPAYFLLQPTAHGPRRLAFAVDRHQLRFLPMTLRLAAPTRRAFPRFPPPLLCLPPPIPQTKSMPPLRPLCLLACPPPPYLPPQSARPLPLLAAPRSPPRRPPLLLVHWRRWKLSGVHAHTLPP